VRIPRPPRRGLLPPKVEYAFASLAFGFNTILGLAVGKASLEGGRADELGLYPGARVFDRSGAEGLPEFV